MTKAEILRRGIAAMEAAHPANLWQASRFSLAAGLLNTAFVRLAADLVEQIKLAPEEVDEPLREPANPLRVALMIRMAALPR